MSHTFLILAQLGGAGCSGTTLLFLVAFDNPWPLYLSAPVLLFVCGYSYAKRFTSLSHFWLGASLFLAPVAAWVAIRGPDGAGLKVPLILGGAVLFWVAGFDILYACQDVDFDRRARLRSVPAALGVPASLRVALLCHLLMLGLLAALRLSGNGNLRAEVAELLRAHGLPTELHDVDPDAVVMATARDKKRVGEGPVPFVLLSEPGHPRPGSAVSARDLISAVRELAR